MPALLATSSRMKSLLLLFVLVTAALAGDVKLPSGRVLKNAQVGPIIYTTGIPSSLCLKYETTQDINSQTAITAEVTEAWTGLRVDAEKGNYRSAVIMVTSPPTRSLLITKSEQRNFVFERKDGKDAAWAMLLPTIWQDQKPPGRQPPNWVRGGVLAGTFIVSTLAATMLLLVYGRANAGEQQAFETKGKISNLSPDFHLTLARAFGVLALIASVVSGALGVKWLWSLFAD